MASWFGEIALSSDTARRALKWSPWLLGAALVLGLGHLAYDRVMNARLLRAPASALEDDGPLRRFAVRQAEPLYARHCASCHGADLRGHTVLGGADLSDQDWLYGQGRISEIEQTILYGVRSGHPKTHNLASMPAFGSQTPYKPYPVTPLSPAEIDETVEYLRKLGGHDFDAAKAQAGHGVYAGKGGCFDCHAEDGAGDPAIGAPNLVDGVWLTGDGSRGSVQTAIREGRQGVCPSFAGRLPAHAIRALATLVYARSHPTSASSKGQDQ